MRYAGGGVELLPSVEDGCAALVAQLQAGRGYFSRRGFEEDGRADPHVSLTDKSKA